MNASRRGVAAAGLALLVLSAWGRPAVVRAQTAERFSCSPEARLANLNFSLKNLDNVDVPLSSFKGKVILVNFWATWCVPCRIETPWFIEMQNQYGKRGFQAVGISIDDPLDLLKPFVAEHQMNYPVLQGLGHGKILRSAFGPVTGVPTTFIISREGKLCAKHIGLTSREGFENQIEGLLQGL